MITFHCGRSIVDVETGRSPGVIRVSPVELGDSTSEDMWRCSPARSRHPQSLQLEDVVGITRSARG
jgi:hypothetical protein